MFYMCEMQTHIIKYTMPWSCSLENATPGNSFLYIIYFIYIPVVNNFVYIMNCIINILIKYI